MAKTGASPAPKRKNSKSASLLEQDFKKMVHVSQKRETGNATEYLVKYEHSDEPAWAHEDDVDDELIKKFESSLSSASTPLRRSGRVKVTSSVPTSERKRKNVDNGNESKRVKKESPSPTTTTTTSSSPPTSDSFFTPVPSTPTESEHLRRGKSILTIDVNLKPKPPSKIDDEDDDVEDAEEEEEEKKQEEESKTKKKRGRKAAKPKKIPRTQSTATRSPPTPRAEEEAQKFVSLCVGFASLQGYRPTMEDSHTIITDLKVDFLNQKYEGTPVHYFAVYDGHGGDKAAKYLADSLYTKIFSNDMFLQGNFQQSYYNTFAAMAVAV